MGKFKFPVLGVLAGLVMLAEGHELCLDGSGPIDYGQAFNVCPGYDGKRTCGSPSEENALVETAIEATKVGDGPCKDDFILPMMCSKLDAWVAHLFDGETNPPRDIPLLCKAFARDLFATCGGEVMEGNPFLNGTNGSISESYHETEFLNLFSTLKEANETYCFDGRAYDPPAPGDPVETDENLCFERVVSGAPLIVFERVPFPEKNLIVLGSQAGTASLYEMNDVGQAATLVKENFLDFSNRVKFNGEQGFLGMAFHKNFSNNGRLFLSYSCGDAVYCNKEGNTVVEEIFVDDVEDFTITNPNPKKFILIEEQPFGNHNGGQILFRPSSSDPYLYIMLGDGGSGGDPLGKGQDMTTVLGKILRIDIDSECRPDPYCIPPTNPFVGRANTREEIFALGLRNPWRSSFDEGNPEYFFVADVGQNKVEEVNLVVKGGNYGWNRFEGTQDFKNDVSLAAGTTHANPIMEYLHVNNNGKGSITGGYRYRGTNVTYLQDRYIFADLLGKFFLAEESPPGSGQFSYDVVGILCSQTSPLPCDMGSFIFTFGQDMKNELYFATTSGVHRLIPDSFCAGSTLAPTPVPTNNANVGTPIPILASVVYIMGMGLLPK